MASMSPYTEVMPKFFNTGGFCGRINDERAPTTWLGKATYTNVYVCTAYVAYNIPCPTGAKYFTVNGTTYWWIRADGTTTDAATDATLTDGSGHYFSFLRYQLRPVPPDGVIRIMNKITAPMSFIFYT